MKRALLTQIKNDWRENVWIVVELGVVIAAIWVIITVLYALTQGLFRERGFTPDDVYVMQVRMVQKESPEYVVPDSTAGFMMTATPFCAVWRSIPTWRLWLCRATRFLIIIIFRASTFSIATDLILSTIWPICVMELPKS